MTPLAAGWGWLTGPQFSVVLALAGFAVAVVSAWAAVAALSVGQRILVIRRDVRSPRHMEISVRLKGRPAIQRDDFNNGEDLVINVGAPIEKALGDVVVPAGGHGVDFNWEDDSLLLHPALIQQNSALRFVVITRDEPRTPVKWHAPLANVRVTSVRPRRRPPTAFLLPLLGAVAILVMLSLPLAAPGLAATSAYKVVVIAVGVTALGVIGIWKRPARLMTRRLALPLSVAVMLGLAAVTARTAVSLVAPAACTATDGSDVVSPFTAGTYGTECVGYASSSFVFANSVFTGEPLPQQQQDLRIQFDEQRIYAENQLVEQRYQTYQAQGSSRKIVELAYFAGLTEGVDEDYDSAESEELEGLLAAQQNSLSGNGPLLKIVIANGGPKMLAAEHVANLLVVLARKDPGFLGVVGMDRSTKEVGAAIKAFAENHIPVLATTLSADGIGHGISSPYYFQMSSSNATEADLIRRYIQVVVGRVFATKHLRAQRIVIYDANPNQDDLYIYKLVNDLTNEPWSASGLPPSTRVYAAGLNQTGKALCGASTVDIYAGRHDSPPGQNAGVNDFTQFLSYIAYSCPGDKPFIIADDGVTRFVSDPAVRSNSTQYNLMISYVTKGIRILESGSACIGEGNVHEYQVLPSGFCSAYRGIVANLRVQIPGLKFLWTGERVGLAYDAANLLLYAASYANYSRIQMPAAIQQVSPYNGVTGTVDFSNSHIGNLPQAIVTIDLSSTTSTPGCQFPAGQPGYIDGPGPGLSTCLKG